jgi:hypothetical protein
MMDYGSQKRWCGHCGVAVLPVQDYVDWYGNQASAPGRELCPQCHHDTRRGPHNPGLVSPVRAMEDARRI